MQKKTFSCEPFAERIVRIFYPDKSAQARQRYAQKPINPDHGYNAGVREVKGVKNFLFFFLFLRKFKIPIFRPDHAEAVRKTLSGDVCRAIGPLPVSDRNTSVRGPRVHRRGQCRPIDYTPSRSRLKMNLYSNRRRRRITSSFFFFFRVARNFPHPFSRSRESRSRVSKIAESSDTLITFSKTNFCDSAKRKYE